MWQEEGKAKNLSWELTTKDYPAPPSSLSRKRFRHSLMAAVGHSQQLLDPSPFYFLYPRRPGPNHSTLLEKGWGHSYGSQPVLYIRSSWGSCEKYHLSREDPRHQYSEEVPRWFWYAARIQSHWARQGGGHSGAQGAPPISMRMSQKPGNASLRDYHVAFGCHDGCHCKRSMHGPGSSSTPDSWAMGPPLGGLRLVLLECSLHNPPLKHHRLKICSSHLSVTWTRGKWSGMMP